MLKMAIEEHTLAAPKSVSRMTSRQKGKKGKPSYVPPGLSEQEDLYIKALEEELIEQRLRVKLYQRVLSQASEELGIDILKKIGVHRSGP